MTYAVRTGEAGGRGEAKIEHWEQTQQGGRGWRNITCLAVYSYHTQGGPQEARGSCEPVVSVDWT